MLLLLQNFSALLTGQEQVLSALLTEGRQLVERSEGRDRVELSRKLHQLQEQWQTVVRQAAYRKSLIEQRAQQWLNFEALCSRLNTWLGGVEVRLVPFDFSVCSVQKMRRMLEQIRALRKEFQGQEEAYQRCVEVGHTLAETLEEASGREELSRKQQALHRRWCKAIVDIDRMQVRLEQLTRLWTEVDDGIEDVVDWLKEIRSFSQQELPGLYDDLQMDLQQCKVRFCLRVGLSMLCSDWLPA